jgi:hypothetical protein
VPDPALADKLTGSLDGDSPWVEVTGHFDDPRAVDCRATANPSEYPFYLGHAEAVRTCRQQFVVTELASVTGP